jgi:alpha-glucosidase
MNEPAVMDGLVKTFPMDGRHDYDGNHLQPQKSTHNIYGTQMARAAYEGKFCVSKTSIHM